MIGHKVFILSYNCSMSVFMLRILLEGFSAPPAFFPNYFYIEKVVAPWFNKEKRN